MPRGRFAPSPTGDLHLGGARTALCAWLAARRDRSSFVLRMEDLDGPRVVAGAAERILEDLRWMGLDWDEGPDVGGPHAPYDQSLRGARYAAAIDRLLAVGAVYPCWCSRAEVRRSATAPHGLGDDGPRYPGTCRALSVEEGADRASARPRFAMRLAVPDGEVDFTDEVAGAQRQDVARTVGDFVLRRADGQDAYQLAVVVDDLEMGIEEVVRGDDLLASTPRQILLYRLLGAPRLPRFAHVPLILGPDGKRLSKRHGAVAVRALRDGGVTAPRLIGRLAATLGLCDSDASVWPGELTPRFDLARLPRVATVIDPAEWLGAA